MRVLETFCENMQENNTGSNGNIIFQKGGKIFIMHPVMHPLGGAKMGRLGKTKLEIGEFSTLSTGFSTAGEKVMGYAKRLT